MGIFDPQPLPSTPTSQSTSTGAINPWAQPYIQNYLNQAQGLVANQGFTPLQQQAFSGVSGLQGGTTAQQGLNAAQQGITGALGAGQAYQTAATTPAAIQAYMSPYIQSTLNPQLAELERQYGITGTQEQSDATKLGAFGGSREALMAAENQRNKNMAMDKATAQGYQNAFQAAQQAQQFGSTLGLQGNQAGIAGGNQLATQGSGILGLQNQFGTQQQQYPYQQLGFLQSMMQGLPVASQTTQGWQSGPNKASQIAGLGTAGAGLLGKLLGGGTGTGTGTGTTGGGSNILSSGYNAVKNWLGNNDEAKNAAFLKDFLSSGKTSAQWLKDNNVIPEGDPGYDLSGGDTSWIDDTDWSQYTGDYNFDFGDIFGGYDPSSGWDLSGGDTSWIDDFDWSSLMAKGGKVKSYANGGLVALALDKALKG
jgi:hypothetical protein